MRDWLSSPELAALAGISEQKARRALARAVEDPPKPWRGHYLETRATHGRGGVAGAAREVNAESLPEPFKSAWKARGRPVQLPLPLGAAKEHRHAAWWKEHLAAALAAPKGSRERGAAITALAGRRLVGPDGVFIVPSRRDVERKVAMLDQHCGEAGFLKKPRKDKGTKVVEVSRPWDALTADMPEETRAALAIAADRFVKSLWASGAVYSVVRRLSAERLALLTRDAGIDRPAAELVQLCTLPKHYLERRRDYRRVHEFNTDAKSYDDSRSRVRLTSAKLMPMDLVYGDVHHFDVLLLRSDGTTATPKGIAWLDAANRRVRIDLVLCEPNTAIRNEDLILSFVKMTQDPRWGLPRRLYLDNGSEYQFAELLEAALKLASLGCDVAEWSNPVIRAQPYNAAAKGILEGTFRIIEQKCIGPMKGSLHGDRMRKKSASLGKAAVPFGYFDAFAKTFEGQLLYFNQDPQQGDLKGLSPHQKFAEQVAAGWRPIAVEESTAWMLFSEPGTAMVTKGGISVGGIRYHHDDLFRFNGRKLPIQVPKYLVWRAIPVFTPEGRPLCIAEEEIVFDRQDPAGAVETGRRKVANRGTIAGMAAEVEQIDVPAVMVASAARQPAPPAPEPRDTVRMAGGAEDGERKVKRAPPRDVPANKADQDALRARLAVHSRAGRKP